MGDAQRLSPEDQIALAREQFEAAEDFTVAVEEEFAVLDPESLELANRFEELQDAAKGTALEEHLVGELIASEVEVRTGRCETSPRLPRRWASGAHSSSTSPTRSGSRSAARARIRGAPGRTSASSTRRTTAATTRSCGYVVWRNNSFGIHVHTAINGVDRAIAVNNALRNWLPELLALSASSPFVEGVSTRLHSARTEIFTRMFPRCGVPDSFASWDDYERFVRFLYDTKSIDEHTQIWWSVRPHLAFPTIEVRIGDGQPDLEEARSLAALMHALTVRAARAIDEGEPLPDHPHRLIEENLWRAIRFGLGGEMIDLATGRVRSTRAAVEELIEWSLPAAEETGRGLLPPRPGGQRGRAADRPPRRRGDPRGDLRRAGQADPGP